MYLFCKRVFDVAVVSAVMIIFSPVFLLVALLVKLDSPGPVLFVQQRLGKGGKVFNMYKFRSMILDAENGGVYSGKGDTRVTRIGRFIRMTGIDELPQCVNIFKGDMSIIGPRPPLVYHPWPYQEYTREQQRMFDMRPGVTGWAQIHGRKIVQWDYRIELSCWYVENANLWLDAKIFFITIAKVLINDSNENIGETAAPQRAGATPKKEELVNEAVANRSV